MKNIWLSKSEIASLPTSGSAWDTVVKYANQATGAADLSNQDSPANVQCLAAALVYARTGDSVVLERVKASLNKIVSFSASSYVLGRALALGRELCAYVIAADLIDLPAADVALNEKFITALRGVPDDKTQPGLLTKKTTGGPSNLIACQVQRPNNWGMHAAASVIAVQAYLGDTAGLKKSADIFKGWLGDYNAYHAFDYTAPMDWHADPSKPVGINPKGATKNGHSIDGVLPDDLRRGGGFAWPPKSTGYPWEALQGATVAAQLLTRAGYPAWEWCDKALLRAATWLYDVAKWPAEGDDQWQPWLLNAAYGTNFPTSATATAGKNMAFTQWTHATPVIVKPPVPDPCAACQAELAITKDELAKVKAEMAQIKTAIEEWLKWWDGGQ